LKFWRYVDLAKFMHMLATGTLYFPCVTELKDPYEGWLPPSLMNAMMGLTRPSLHQLKNSLDSLRAQLPNCDPAPLDAILEDAQRMVNVQTTLRAVNIKFGVNCWHVNEHESEAMWQLYTAAGQGIAIESTSSCGRQPWHRSRRPSFGKTD
jgi:hypothetical protein